jgi:hypothetical protein
VADEVEQAVEEDLVDHEVAFHSGLHLSNPAIANTVLFISSKRSKIKYRVPTSNQHWTSRNGCLDEHVAILIFYILISSPSWQFTEEQKFVRVTVSVADPHQQVKKVRRTLISPI